MATAPKLPVVLVHGYLGFAKVGRVEYFDGIVQDLQSTFPGIRVITPTLSPAGSHKDRAAQLEDQILSAFPGERMHIIAHSAGGVDARFLAAPKNNDGCRGRDDLVATITTISSPHLGTDLAEVLSRLRKGDFDPTSRAFLGWLVKRLFALPTLVQRLKINTAGHPHLMLAEWTTITGQLRTYLRDLISLDDFGLKQYTPEEMAKTNQICVDSPNVQYFYYAGSCRPESVPPLLALPYLILMDKEGPNDGIVSVRSASRGIVPVRSTSRGDRRCEVVEADHAEEIGLDLTGMGGRSFDHLAFYRSIVGNLKP